MGDLIEESIYQFAEKISKLYQDAYDAYLLLVKDVCSREVSEDELAHFLDYLLDFACDEKYWGCIKRCVKDIYMYIRGIKFYIEAYREMWEDENAYLA